MQILISIFWNLLCGGRSDRQENWKADE